MRYEQAGAEKPCGRCKRIIAPGEFYAILRYEDDENAAELDICIDCRPMDGFFREELKLQADYAAKKLMKEVGTS